MKNNGLINMVNDFQEVTKDKENLSVDYINAYLVEYCQSIVEEEKSKLIELNDNIIKFIIQNRDDIYSMLKFFDEDEKKFVTTFINEFSEAKKILEIIQRFITALSCFSIYGDDKTIIDAFPYTVDFFSGGLTLCNILSTFKDKSNFNIPFRQFLADNTSDMIDFFILDDSLFKETQINFSKYNREYHVIPQGNEYVSNILIYLFKIWCNIAISENEYNNLFINNKGITNCNIPSMPNYDNLSEMITVSIPIPLHTFYYEDNNLNIITFNWNYIVDKYLVFSRDPSLYFESLMSEKYSIIDNDSSSMLNFILTNGAFPFKYSNAFLYLDKVIQENEDINLYYTMFYNNGIPVEVYKDISSDVIDTKKGIKIKDKLDSFAKIQININMQNNKLSCYVSDKISFSGCDKCIDINKIITPLDLWYGFKVGFESSKTDTNNLNLKQIYECVDNFEELYIVERNDNGKYSVKKINKNGNKSKDK